MKRKNGGVTLLTVVPFRGVRQAKYGPLHSNHQSVARAGASPPTFAEFQGACVVAKELTVRDVWGLILTAIDGMIPSVLRNFHNKMSSWPGRAPPLPQPCYHSAAHLPRLSLSPHCFNRYPSDLLPFLCMVSISDCKRPLCLPFWWTVRGKGPRSLARAFC